MLAHGHRVECVPRAESGPIFDFYLGKNTPERKDYLRDNLLYGLQTTPACSPVPLDVNATPTEISLNWQDDGFRLQGAETLCGPRYDLGVEAPVTLPVKSAARFFRLLCD